MHGRAIRHHWHRVAVVTALVLTLAPVHVLAAPPGRSLNTVDVTNTTAGRDAAQAAADRMALVYGVSAHPDSLVVWQVGDSLIVGPKGGTIVVREAISADGQLRRWFEASEPGDEPGTAVATSEMTVATAGWQLVGDHCWIDSRSGIGWMDVCYHKYKATSDGSSTYDYYDLQMFSTFASSPPWEIGDPYIQSNPGAGAAHTWFDWEPRVDKTVSCSPVFPSLTVNVGGFALTLGADQCDTWDITKYAAAGQFRNKWTEGFCSMRYGETELAFHVASRVAQSQVPTWTFNWYENVQPASCYT